MTRNNETASLTGLTGSVVSKAVAASNYQIHPSISTSNYAAAKLATRFRLRIETARLICTLSGIGGAQ